jgi:hypothetical protein
MIERLFQKAKWRKDQSFHEEGTWVHIAGVENTGGWEGQVEKGLCDMLDSCNFVLKVLGGRQ